MSSTAGAPDSSGQGSSGQGSSGQGHQGPRSFYEAVGGAATFEAITQGFYAEVAKDPLLAPMYPEDLAESELHLRLFLEQYWGGPRTYSESRGHPRLRMRHVPFVIGPAERDAWLRCMRAGVDAVSAEAMDDARRAELWAYLEMAANSLMNAP